ncbi:hypothetical protein Ato02nite_017910 [Paractinoplanes toevensis]|uniref:Uncharacterized protein n=1 Tax=Paractinoplanes toevensis TaxID=571911 RepID=A0A919T6Y8_9ACTN|nr:hypothetical protein Ato02nite_017910 [Actinoplanes toevensis]
MEQQANVVPPVRNGLAAGTVDPYGVVVTLRRLDEQIGLLDSAFVCTAWSLWVWHLFLTVSNRVRAGSTTAVPQREVACQGSLCAAGPDGVSARRYCPGPFRRLRSFSMRREYRR